jgi:DNA-binding NarL/FixJ family response regulator
MARKLHRRLQRPSTARTTGSATGAMVKILVADEHALYRTGLRVMLQSALPEADFLEAADLDGLMRHLTEEKYIHLALVGLSLTRTMGPRTIWDFKRASGLTRYIVVSTDCSFDEVLQYIAEGFHGFVSTLQRDDEIAGAVRDVLAGRLSIPRDFTPFGSTPESQRSRELPQRHLDTQPYPFGLTPRQKDVLRLLADGLSNREIAQALDIAEPTAKTHLSGLMRVLNVRNRTEAAVLAQDLIRTFELDPEPRTGPRQGKTKLIDN